MARIFLLLNAGLNFITSALSTPMDTVTSTLSATCSTPSLVVRITLLLE